MGRKSKSKKVQRENSPLPPVLDVARKENSQNISSQNSALQTENEYLIKENQNLKKENQNLKEENEELLKQLGLLQKRKSLDERSLKKEKHKSQGENIDSETQVNDMEIVDDTCYGDAHNKSLNKVEEILGCQWEEACADVSETDGSWAAEDFKDNIGSSEKTYMSSKKYFHPEKHPAASRYDREMPLTEFQEDPRNKKGYHDPAFDENRNRGRRQKGYQDSEFNYDRYKGQNEHNFDPSYKGYHNSAYDEKRNRCLERNDGRKTNVHDPNKTYNTSSNHYKNYNQRSKMTYSSNYRRGDNFHSKYDPIEKQDPIKLKLIEVNGDLFEAPKSNSLAHCVAADLRMGSGIAVEFKQKFKRLDDLVDQRKKVGEVAVLEDNGRFIYYLITKKFSTGKPRLGDLRSSLLEMRGHVEENAVMNIAMPRIGCGLDRLHWKDVRELVHEVFDDLDITITVYTFMIEPTADIHKKSSLYVTNKLMRLVDIAKDTLLLLFGSESGHVDSNMQELDEKFRFMNDYTMKSRRIGDVIQLKKRGEVLCILIVKKDARDVISYSALLDCLGKVKKIFKEEKYFYMGLTAFVDENDDLTVAKIITLFNVLFSNVRSELWICWPTELKNVYDEYFPRNE